MNNLWKVHAKRFTNLCSHFFIFERERKRKGEEKKKKNEEGEKRGKR